MASVEKLYCGTAKCSETDNSSNLRYYCKNKAKDITGNKAVQLPQSSQIPPDFLLGYTKTEMGGNSKGYGCGFKTVYTKNKDWVGWAPPKPSCKSNEDLIDGNCLVKCLDGQIRMGTTCTSAADIWNLRKDAPAAVNTQEAPEYLTPDKVYCGTAGCSTTDEGSIRRYCRGPGGNVLGFHGSDRSPEPAHISSKYMPGYVSTEIGSGCELRKYYFKNPDWSGWNKRVEKPLQPSSSILDSINKCCKTFASLNSTEQLECGKINPESDTCKKMILK